MPELILWRGDILRVLTEMGWWEAHRPEMRSSKSEVVQVRRASRRSSAAALSASGRRNWRRSADKAISFFLAIVYRSAETIHS